MPQLDKKPKVFLEEFRVKVTKLEIFRRIKAFIFIINMNDRHYIIYFQNAPEDYGMADEKWNFKKFAKNFRIVIVRMDNSEMEFDLIGIQPAFANAFRRLMLSEVPSMAIEKVMIKNNTSIIQDEVLAHRLGLIPLKADPKLFEYRPEGTLYHFTYTN